MFQVCAGLFVFRLLKIPGLMVPLLSRALRNLCASCSAQVLGANCSVQVLWVKHAALLCASCSAQVALRKLLCARALCKLLCCKLLCASPYVHVLHASRFIQISTRKCVGEVPLHKFLCARSTAPIPAHGRKGTSKSRTNVRSCKSKKRLGRRKPIPHSLRSWPQSGNDNMMEVEKRAFLRHLPPTL